ncbi:hypothetical protein [Mycolicibacterium sp. P1-18]|uniref:hypothetical protein n=1 Tax=Mycolicibacterium sp. P1-18 TaxID=2024615 RepID=UPI0011F0B183|nr:hypothetical protein [Mycolicibacterium sp. P1-18]
MITNECVQDRPVDTEDVLSLQYSSSADVAAQRRGAALEGLRRRLASLRHRRAARVHPRLARPPRPAHRADFMERAAMSREMHRL